MVSRDCRPRGPGHRRSLTATCYLLWPNSLCRGAEGRPCGPCGPPGVAEPIAALRSLPGLEPRAKRAKSAPSAQRALAVLLVACTCMSLAVQGVAEQDPGQTTRLGGGMSHWTASAVSQEESPGFYVLTFEVGPSGASRHKLKGVLGQSWLDLRNAPCSDRTYHWRLSMSAFSSGRRTLLLPVGFRPRSATSCSYARSVRCPVDAGMPAFQHVPGGDSRVPGFSMTDSATNLQPDDQRQWQRKTLGRGRATSVA